MGMCFGPRRGYWSLRSKTDPRWDASGQSNIISVMGLCPEAEQSIERTKRRLKEAPPDDLEYSCMKD